MMLETVAGADALSAVPIVLNDNTNRFLVYKKM